ncbi:unnamed protein product [Paramecium primaurelia]|uniref:OTU domain-containing protein n=1 Tax=Paramecium primaurelia TaxID=5886 RepID=A0A8S1NZQ7_PARPR|nr:unnamed protein product [Paramecium primaurelia]
MSQQCSNKYAYNQELYEQQLDKIKNEIEAQDQFIITQPIELQILESEYLENQGFLKKINVQNPSIISIFRIMRREGSCFYRAVLFRICSIKRLANIKQISIIISNSEADLSAVGYELIVIDDFYDDIMKYIKLCPNKITIQGIVDAFCNKAPSDYHIMYMRMMTFGYIKANLFLFEGYLETGTVEADQDIKIIQKGFISQHCRTTYKFQLGYSIWMGILPPSMPQFFKFQKICIFWNSIFINLFYRRGHYDILYPK